MVVVLCLALPLLLLPCAKWVWFSNSWGWADCLLLIREFWVGQFVLSLVSLDHILLFCLKVFFFFVTMEIDIALNNRIGYRSKKVQN